MSSQAILIENLTKSYGTFRAVDGLTFDVKVGGKFLDFWDRMELERPQRFSACSASSSLTMEE